MLSELVEIAQKTFNNRDDPGTTQSKKIVRILVSTIAEQEKQKDRQETVEKRKGNQGKKLDLGANQCTYCKENEHWKNECPKRRLKGLKSSPDLVEEVTISFRNNSAEFSFNTNPSAILITYLLSEEYLLTAEVAVQAPGAYLRGFKEKIPGIWAETNLPGLASHWPPIVVQLTSTPIPVTQYQVLVLDPLRIHFLKVTDFNPVTLLLDDNPSELMHDCHVVLESLTNLRADLTNNPWPSPDEELCTDGSSYISEGIRYAGAVVVTAQWVIWAQTLGHGTLAQKAKLTDLTQALRFTKVHTWAARNQLKLLHPPTETTSLTNIIQLPHLHPGYQVCKSDVASQLVQGEELWGEGIGFFQNQNSVLSGREDSVKEQEMPSVHHICKKEISTIMSLEQNSYTQKNGIICSKLPEDCTHSSRVIQHVLTHKGMKSYFSNLFGKALNDLSSFNQQQNLHPGSKSYECHLIEKSFVQNSGHTHYNVTHVGEEPCEYHLFGKTFTKYSELRQHERTHTGEKPYECQLCGKAFTYYYKLKQHENTHTGEKSYECHLCGKAFTYSWNLKKHERTHTGEKPFECNLCGKAFSLSSYLREHERIHTGEKPYECHLCGKAFTRCSTLRKHKKIHTGETPYECHLCGKVFAFGSCLREHEKIHTGEKPYECQRCGKAFTYFSKLKRHENTHTGEKSYECHLCGKAFSQSSNLRRHEKTHTGEKPYECHLCQKVFTHYSNLRKHKRSHTVMKP
ncbi:uncharacterized protein LOC143680405 [Tamandua tetradactyla]|uniref:uncharacterized protein LOC143680405 n=1 Tax=Tamandua tetradactyla TaxID=48850 RepID=UPI0040544EAA